MKNKVSFLLSIFTVLGLVFLAQESALAQGRGNAGGAGRGNSGAVRPSGNSGADRGLGNASIRSNGRSDTGLSTANERSNGRSNTGLERARLRRENARRADRAVSDNPQAARLLNMNANNLRQAYEAALANNPDLKFGQFVAANMLARNLGTRFPNVTTAALLDGLATGNGFGRTLKTLGLTSREAKDAERDVKQTMQNRKDND